MSTEYDPDELYLGTESDTIEEWIEACEEADEDSSVRFSPWEQEFLVSIRGQFDRNVGSGRKRPLTGKQLCIIRRCFDKVNPSSKDAEEELKDLF